MVLVNDLVFLRTFFSSFLSCALADLKTLVDQDLPFGGTKSSGYRSILCVASMVCFER